MNYYLHLLALFAKEARQHPHSGQNSFITPTAAEQNEV